MSSMAYNLISKDVQKMFCHLVSYIMFVREVQMLKVEINMVDSEIDETNLELKKYLKC